MSLQVIDNKFVDMTDAEYAEYEKICEANERPNCRGEEVFRDRFVVDDNGRIVYLRALGNRQISYEALFFLMNLMQNQHLRAMYQQVQEVVNKANEKINVLNEKEIVLNNLLKKTIVEQTQAQG